MSKGAEVCLATGLTSLYRSSATTEVLVGTGRLLDGRVNRRVLDSGSWEVGDWGLPAAA